MRAVPRTNSVAYHSPSRRPKPLARSSKDIADTTHRLQQLSLEWTIDLVPEPADQDVDDVRLRIEVVIPDVRQNHRLRDDLSRVAHQVLEKGRLEDDDSEIGRAHV